MPLGLFPRETSDLLAPLPDEAGTSAPPTPGFFAGMFGGAALGVGEGGVKLAQATGAGSADLVSALSPNPDFFTPPPDVVEIDPAEQAQRQYAAQRQVIDAFKPDPRLVGTAGQTLNGVASGLTQMLIGSATGLGPVAGAAAVAGGEGYATHQDMIVGGVDPRTANLLSAASAMFAGAGALMPGGFGSTFAERVATGAAAQTALGVTNRGLMSLVLDRSGYADMAKAYVPFDGMAMLADGILGAGFGAVHHAFAPSVVDAARVVKDAEHVEHAAPGVPVDPESRAAVHEAIDAHVEALIRGDETPPPTGDVRYVPDPAQDAAREAALRDIRDAVEEIAPGRVDAAATPERMSSKDYLAFVKQRQMESADLARLSRETIDTSEDSLIGRNDAGESVYERSDGYRYRMRNGKPDFGGDLATVSEQFAETLDPDVREALQQAQAVLAERGDVQIGGEGQEPIDARGALQRAIDSIKESAGADDLHRVAAACFGRV